MKSKLYLNDNLFSVIKIKLFTCIFKNKKRNSQIFLRFSPLLIILFLGFSSFAQLPTIDEPVIYAPQKTVYMAVDGDDDNLGTNASPVASFQRAMELIPFGAVGVNGGHYYGEIVLKAGNYYPTLDFYQWREDYEVNGTYKNISLRGEGEVNIYGDNVIEDNGNLVKLIGSHISIKNLNIYNAKGKGMFLYNFKYLGECIENPFNPNCRDYDIKQMTDVLVEDVYIDGTVSHGLLAIYIDRLKAENVIVTKSCLENNGITNCKWGSSLRVEKSKNVIFRNCETYHNKGEGINTATSTKILVEKCTSYDNLGANLYCIQSGSAIYRNNLVYNQDSIYWRTCTQYGDGEIIPFELNPSPGFAIENEVNFGIPNNNCSTNLQNVIDGVTFNYKLADSIYFYNNILILAPLIIYDDSYGSCLFPDLNNKHNNFSNIYIENNTFIGDISLNNEYLNRQPLITGSFNFLQGYPTFLGCNPFATGPGVFRCENINIRNNVFSAESYYLSSKDQGPLGNITYGGDPCNGGSLPSKFSVSDNLWNRELPSTIRKHQNNDNIYVYVPNFLKSNSDLINENALTYCNPSNVISLTPDVNNGLIKNTARVSYITEDFNGNARSDITHAGAIQGQVIVSTNYFESDDNQFVLYPNPSNGIYWLDIKNSSLINENVSVKIIDELGRLVYSKLGVSEINKIDITNVANGVYFLILESNKDKWIEKFVKEEF